MDYGRPVNLDKQPEFFTTGAGSNQENLNNFEAENNLELDNRQASWDVTRNRDNRNIGNVAINAPQIPKSVEGQMMPNGEELPEFGEVVDAGVMPSNLHASDEKDEQSSAKFNRKNIKTGEKLGDEGVKEVQGIMNKLNQDGNVADFYDEAREMMEVNLDNSYGANAAWKGGKAA